MVKQNIIDHLTHRCGLRMSSAIAAVNGTVELIADTLKKGEDVSLRGLGTFKVRDVAEKTARDINANRPITIPAHKAVKFIPATEIKEALKNEQTN